MGGVRCAGSVLSAAQAAKAACGSFCHCVCADTLPAAAGADRISPVSSAWDSASGWLCSDGFGMLSSTARTAGRTGALFGPILVDDPTARLAACGAEQVGADAQVLFATDGRLHARVLALECDDFDAQRMKAIRHRANQK